MIELQNQTETDTQETAPFPNIVDGVIIHNEFYMFKEQKLLNGLIRMQLPVTFFAMPEGVVKMKYSGAQTPNLVVTNEDGTINIIHSVLDNVATDQPVEKVVDQIKSLLKRANPSINILETNNLEISGYPASSMEYVSPSMDSIIYNLCAYIRTKNQLIIIGFNLPSEQSDAWKSVISQMLNSICIDFSLSQFKEF